MVDHISRAAVLDICGWDTFLWWMFISSLPLVKVVLHVLGPYWTVWQKLYRIYSWLTQSLWSMCCLLVTSMPTGTLSCGIPSWLYGPASRLFLLHGRAVGISCWLFLLPVMVYIHYIWMLLYVIMQLVGLMLVPMTGDGTCIGAFLYILQ